MIGGKVLDPSSLAAYVRGGIAMAGWVNVAPELGLTLILPELAILEVRSALPGANEQLATLLDSPSVVRDDLTAANAIAVMHHLDRYGAFDAAAGHVVHLAMTRNWPVLSADPARLQRLAPDLEIDLVV